MERVLADTTLTPASYYFSWYVLEALRKAGLADRYIERLAPWQTMLRSVSRRLRRTPSQRAPTRMRGPRTRTMAYSPPCSACAHRVRVPHCAHLAGARAAAQSLGARATSARGHRRPTGARGSAQRARRDDAAARTIGDIRMAGATPAIARGSADHSVRMSSPVARVARRI